MIIVVDLLDGFLIEQEIILFKQNPFILFDQIVVTDLRDPKTKYIAICNKWLAKDEDDGLISRDLPLKKEGIEVKKSKKRNLK